MEPITIDKAKYDELLEVTRWYDNQPKALNNVVSDSFHESIYEFKIGCVPDNVVAEEAGYVASVELKDNELYAVIGMYDDGKEHSVKIIPK